MKIAVISKANRNGGGASQVAEDLAIWLNKAGYPTDHFIAVFDQQSHSFQKSLYGKGLRRKLCQLSHRTTKKFGLWEILPAEYWLTLNHIIDQYDIIHFHDLYKHISPLTLALTSQRKPTFFTVHDCSAFTGGCLYPQGCEKFASQCYQCPQLPQKTWKNRLRDHSKEIHKIKRWLARQAKIQYIFPSAWIAQQASLSLSFKIPPVIIPNSIDLDPFLHTTKREAQIALDIPEHRKVVVISAHYLADPRKGAKYAIAALQSCRHFSPLVLIVGHCDDELRASLKGLEIKEIGYIENSKEIAQTYLAADIMLFCSLEEVFGLTVLEAMAASCVIVGFSTGGVPEIIKTGRNGILVETANQESLNQALHQALTCSNLESMAEQARKDVENKFAPNIFLRRHLEIYRMALNNY
ncbi:glycosyltransferase [Euhalothece natronophila Z-M001]|uniref:Glycosyltransferase n=1 Tax=Euhalothece natronophila Z-M001 TaxID=522448 RepID=A0A5B8NJI0_9CHRO|nr:glycosyltransferase [Euhalothece natronophila]QDZ39127.1 glycosyltransferase [Euhalothece natronophila Z-M001]